MLQAALAGVGCLDCANQFRNVTCERHTLPFCLDNNCEVRITGDEGLDFNEVDSGLLQRSDRAPTCLLAHAKAARFGIHPTRLC